MGVDKSSLRICRSLLGKNWKAFISREISSSHPDNDLTDSLKHSIENKWKALVSKGTYDKHDESTEKSYILSMFPYPSGNLHMGHVRVYTISDTIARFHRLNGKNVFHPMGFDAFGLPAENAAIEKGIPASTWTWNNIENMRKQLKELNLSFDWDYEVVTCSSDYYKFTQYIFLLLHKARLVYRREALVNWDPVDNTVLADEQVDANGRSWRSNALVEKKILKQWFIRTTKFAQSLREGLEDPRLKDWKDVVKLQKHWIGDCDGAYFELKLENKNKTINVWTQYPELIRKAAFIGVAPGSSFDIEGCTGLKAVNPFTNKTIPLVVTYNDCSEGCEFVLGLPDVFEKDRDLAESLNLDFEYSKGFEPNIEERHKICRLATEAGIGGYLCSSKLRDWLISRQRYWGTPIPVVYCESCGTQPLRFEDLPVVMPEPGAVDSWAHTECPKCKGKAIREKDTMDTFVDSAWYFLRYIDPQNLDEPFSKELASNLMPIDVYVGGKEHATLHLFYARFLSHFFYSIGFLNEREPFKRLLVQGMVMGKTFKVPSTGKYIPKENVDFSGGKDCLKEKATGLPVEENWDKMSKSKYNGVDPQSMLDRYGIDTTRLFMLSDVAPTSHKYWSEESFSGILNWQRRIWSLMNSFLAARNGEISISKAKNKGKPGSEEEKVRDARNYYTKGTTFNYVESHQLSVGLSKLQGFTNSLKKCSDSTMQQSLEFEKALGSLIIMLSPMAPHFSSELWNKFQSAPNRLDTRGIYFDWDRSVLEQSWPSLDGNYELELICKVNNAVKGSILVPYKKLKVLPKSEAVGMALANKKVSSFIKGCDLLRADYTVIDNYESIVNLIIDHHQKGQIAKANL